MARTQQKDTPSPCLVYNEGLAAEVRQVLPPRWVADLGLEREGDMALVTRALSMFEPMPHAFLPEDPPEEHAELLFYICMCTRRERPELFPVPDVCLAAFNLLAARHILAGSTVCCLDWALLPVALLAAGQGARVLLPGGTGFERGADWMPSFLSRVLPRSGWTLANEGSAPPEGALVLGQHPVPHTENSHDFLFRLARIRGGVFFTFWDFLGVALHAHVREQWLKSGLIRSILQLPRPRRQVVTYYPALVELGTAATDAPVRMSAIGDIGPGPGSLPQDQVLRGILAPPDGKNSVDVPPRELRIKGVPDFTPRLYLARSNTPELTSSTITLGQCAHIIRCQLHRSRLEEWDLDALTQVAAITGVPSGGAQADGSCVCREITLADLDPLTGFVLDRGNLVRLADLNPAGRQGKYLLQAGDILMSFRGTEPTLGKVGFVESEAEMPAISGQSLCLIRPFAVDAVWLYHHLQRSQTREWILARAVGSKMLTVNLGDLREMPLAPPAPATVEQYHARHHNIARAMASVRRLQEEMTCDLRALWEMGESEFL